MPHTARLGDRAAGRAQAVRRGPAMHRARARLIDGPLLEAGRLLQQLVHLALQALPHLHPVPAQRLT